MTDFEVLYEDNHLLIVNKPSGMLVQGDATGDVPLADLAKRYIKEKYNKPGEVFLGVVHRLDRPVTGVVVLARTSKALQRMNELFREKETQKTYLAVVNKRPPSDHGHLTHWLVKDEKKNKTTAFSRETPGAQKSELDYSLIGSANGWYLLEVKPITGRPHQIRVQLASMGCIIAGDLKYGAAEVNEDGSICLHAKQLEFVHPVKKEPIVVSAHVPSSGPWKNFSHLND